MTKKQILERVQEIANEYLKTNSLNFIDSAYKRLSKPELEARLENAEKMIIYHRESESLKNKFDGTAWEVAKLFPMTAPDAIRQATLVHSELVRKAMDYWGKV